MNRRDFLKATGLTAATAASAGAGRPALPKRKRNVLLYVVDDQGSTDAGCYGNPVIKTPGLDALAAEGTRFTNAFCTTASCSASRSVILSGLHNHNNGQYGHQHGYNHFASFDRVRSLPALLGEAGYRTYCAGKYHVAPETVYPFGEFIKTRTAPEMAESCRPILESQDDAPFFLYFCTTEPHRRFDRPGIEPVPTEDVLVPPYLPDIPECREELAYYYGLVERADKGLLMLMEMLRETGHWNDTLIIYISDNGIAFPGAKTTTYDPGIRLPCVVRHPEQDARGVVSEAMVSWTDLTPTILDYAGVAPPDYDLHGRSFLDVLEDPAPPGWDRVFASHTFHEITMYYPMRVVRTREHKLIWNIAHDLPYPFASDLWASKTWQATLERGLTHYGKRTVDAYLHRPEFELYDLENDPHEVDNLIADPAYAKVQKELKEELREFQTRTRDPWVLKWRYE